MHGIYKYEHDEKVIYIGKTDNSFESRIYAHSRDKKFAPYLEKASISVHETRDAAEADFLETVLIAQHRPILNAAKKLVTNASVYANIEWIPWNGGWKQKRTPDEHRTIKGFSFTLNVENAKKLKDLANSKNVSSSKMLDKLMEDFFAGMER